MKKSELKNLIRECIREVLTENHGAPEFLMAIDDEEYMLLQHGHYGDWEPVAKLSGLDDANVKKSIGIIKSKFGKTVTRAKRLSPTNEEQYGDVLLYTA